jgi:putative aldouronate transport system substrate-binding protein
VEIRKSVKVMLPVVLCLSMVLTGCSSSVEVSPTTPGENKEEGKKVMLGQKFDPPITMTTARWTGSTIPFRNGEDMANNVHTRWLKDKMGIELKTLWTVEDSKNYITKLRLSMSAGEMLPDVLVMPDAQLAAELIDSGLVRAVGDEFDKYASDIVKEAYGRDPSLWYPYQKDKKFYGIPIIGSGDHNDDVLFYRSDWLKNVGLSEPKTIDEMEKVMDAFVNLDPDKNGEKDTYGMALAFNDRGWSNGTFIYGAYGAVPGIWQKNKEGKLEYGSINPEIKKALAKMKEWKDKGYIHPEIGLHNFGKAGEFLTSGKAGLIPASIWASMSYLTGVQKNVPNAQLDVMPIPAGPSGKAGKWGRPFKAGVLLFNKDFKHMDAFMLYLNNLYEYWNPENPDFQNGYFNGYDYAMVDGKPVNGPMVPGGQIAVHHYFLHNSQRPIKPYQFQDTLSELYQGKQPTTAFEKYSSMGGDGGALYLKAGHVAKQQRDTNMYDFGIGVTKTMKLRGDRLNQMELETFVKIVYGELPLEAFDEFVKNWKANGGDEVTKEMNEWYNEVNK